jgi:CHASE3 domain sensor protein
MIRTLLSRPSAVLITAGLLLPIVLIGIPAVTAYRAEQEVRKSFHWVTHTLEVETAIQSLVNSLVDAETGQRGFLLTGREPYLEPYQAGVARVARQVREIRTATADNQAQQDRLTEADPLITERLDLLAQTIAAEKRGEHEAAVGLVNSGRGKYVMDKIRAVLQLMVDEEHRLLWRRQQQLSAHTRRSTAISWGLVALAAALGGGVLYLLYRMSRLEPLVMMCAHSRTIEYGGEWLSFEEYLQRRFGISTSHGLSPAEFDRLRSERAAARAGAI